MADPGALSPPRCVDDAKLGAYHEESEPGADIPPELLVQIEANMKACGIMRRPCLKKGK
jgi:hypothetical protein